MDGDARAGLDERTLTEVRRIMERRQVDFDEARRLQVEAMFRKNGASLLHLFALARLGTNLEEHAGIDANGFPIGAFSSFHSLFSSSPSACSY